MSPRTFLAAAAMVFAGTAALAQDVQKHPTPSSLGREQVRAELAAYAGRPSSQVEVFGSDKAAVAAVRDGRPADRATRLARVEVRRSLMAGDNAATIVGESYGGVMAGSGSTLTREVVRAEAVMAMRARSVGRGTD